MDVLTLPLLRYVPLDPPSDLDTTAFDWILFTSPQGVRAFCDAGFPAGQARFGVLGDGSAAALAACGHEDDLKVRALDGTGLARDFVGRITPPAKVLLPGPDRRMDDPRLTLVAAGFDVVELPLYRTDAVAPTELPDDPWRPGDLIFFASPSAVRACAARWGAVAPCVAIGETTAIASREAGFETVVADTPDLIAMIRAAGPDPVPDSKETS